ncbi:MAG: TrbI/VirB10 family protein [Bdellovibrionales bacterium]|nr:TrbI/VirB10 family protein [Bdellovibrionales bacterium]
MEVTTSSNIKNKFSGYFLKEKSHFSNRREINWDSLKKCTVTAVATGVFALLLMPSPNPDNGPFTEQAEGGSTQRIIAGGSEDATETTLNQMRAGERGSSRVSSSLNYLYASNTSSNAGSSGADSEMNSSMIISRGIGDSKSQVPPGSRLRIRLYEKAIVSSQSMPVIGIVTSDYMHEDSVAIPEGSKVFGDINYDDGGDRAKVDWRTIQFPDGRDRPFSAIGVGADGQVGVHGKIHSEAMKNTAGQTLTRFLGAYAEGSMQKGSFGYNQGGNSNGLKNAVAETAKDRADKWADGLKKEKVWIEVSNSTVFYAVLTQGFVFRDPGATNGR